MFWTIFSFARIVKARASVDSLKRSGKDVLLFCGGWFPLLLFRRVYFGEWVPNSVLAKSDEMRWTEQWASPWFEQELARRGEIAIAFIQAHPVIVGLAVAGLLLARRRVPAGMGIGLLAACAVVLMWLGHDWMPYDRLFVITVVPLTVAACAGISALFFQKSQRLGGSNAPSYLVAGALVLICVQENHRQDEYFRHRKEFTNLLANLGTRLAPVLKPGDVLATELAGIVPYHLRAKSIDMLGLCDRHIALHGDHQESFGKRDLEHVIAQEPDFYLFLAAFDAVPLFEHPDFAPRQARYRVIVTEDYLRFKPGEPPLLLIREDFPRLPEVLDRLGAHTVSFREELKRLGHLQ